MPRDRPGSPSFGAEERAFRLRALLRGLKDTEEAGGGATDRDAENVRGNLISMALGEAEALTALY